MTSRRTALATAAAIVLTIATASLAVAANLGMFTDEEPVGQLTPVTSTAEAGGTVPTETPTIYVDENGNVLPFVPGRALPPEQAPAVASTGAPDDRAGPTTAGEDDEVDHDRDDGEDHDEHEADEEEHEGRDDDD